MRKQFLLLCLLGVIGLTCAGCGTQEKAISLKHGDVDEVAKIQLDSYKSTPDEFGEEKVEAFMGKLEEAIPLEEGKEIERDKNPNSYQVISLIYNDEERDMFYFFRKDGEWYIETMSGTIFYGEEALSEIIQFGDVEGGPGVFSMSLEKEDVRKLIELKQSFAEDGLEYYFATDLLQRELEGYTKETALEDTKKWIEEKYRLYQALIEAGYEVTDEELKEAIEEEMDVIRPAENYDDFYAEYLVLYEEADTSVEEILQKEKGRIRYNRMSEKLYAEKYEDFRTGKDTIADQTYDDFLSYYNAYMSEKILPLTEKYDLTEVTKAMETYSKKY